MKRKSTILNLLPRAKKNTKDVSTQAKPSGKGKKKLQVSGKAPAAKKGVFSLSATFPGMMTDFKPAQTPNLSTLRAATSRKPDSSMKSEITPPTYTKSGKSKPTPTYKLVKRVPPKPVREFAPGERATIVPESTYEARIASYLVFSIFLYFFFSF